MKREESLPLIRSKYSLHSFSKKSKESPKGTFINYFGNLKIKMQNSIFKKSTSSQNLFFSQGENNQLTNLLFNEKYKSENIDENYQMNRNNYLLEEALYRPDYLNKFKKIKTILYKKKFYGKNDLKNSDEKKNENEIISETNENPNVEKKDILNSDNINEDNNESENKIDFSQNIWSSDIKLNNDKNYDIGEDNEIENEDNSESENNIPEIKELDNNKDKNIFNKKRKLYITEMQNSNSVNNISSPFNSINIEKNSNYIDQNKNNINFNKIKLVNKKSKDKNPFNFTRFSSLDNISQFHKTYRNFKNLCRKHYINEKSPSFAFMKACDKEKIICNPLGLIKRKGEENILEMNNQHSGDKYIDCLSSGLKYVTHLNTLEMSNNRLTHYGIEKLFQNINQNPTLLKSLIKINLSNNNIGEIGAEYLRTFIEDKSCQLENLNIEGNNLGDKTVDKLCISISQNINNKITHLNLGNNKISKNSEKGLLFMTEKCTELVVLILRNNLIDNSLAAKIIRNINNLYSLKDLDLSWNLIGDHLICPFLFEEAVNYNPNKNNLYNNFELDKIKTHMKMKFNKNPLLPKIDKNTTSKSRNKDKNNEIIPVIKNVKVPERKPSYFAIELSNYIKKSLCPLIHLNISHNNLPYSDCQLISEESKSNRNILGFHVDGNEMQIDPLGFIHPIKKGEKEHNYYSKSQISYDIEKFNGLLKNNISPVNKIRGRNNCWICEYWKEIEFILDLKIKDLKPKYTLVKLHLDFENFAPSDMIYKKKCFRLMRMCPPGKITFFFTVDGNPVINCYKEYDYKIKDFEKPIKYVFDQKFIDRYNHIKSINLNSVNQKDYKNNENYRKNISIQEDERDNEDKLISKTIYIKNYGIRNIVPSNKIVTDDYQSTLKYSTPRFENDLSSTRDSIPWQFSDSIWSFYKYNFEGETDEFLKEMCEFDFNRGEFDLAFIKENDYNDAKNLLFENYKNIIYCYINLSSYSGCNLWQISLDILIEWINEKCNNFFNEKYTSQHLMKVIESQYYNKKDLEDKSKYKNFPSNKFNLIRHNFFALLINASIDRYIKVLRLLTNPFEAFKLSMERHFIPGIQGYDLQLWRKERYYNEEIDNFIKAFIPLLDGLFHTFSKKLKEKESKENENKMSEENNNDYCEKGKEMDEIKMTQEDFNNFVMILAGPEYQSNENPLIFHMSKKIQIDEITNEDCLYLNLIEFCEALCRVIDIYSPAPPEEKIEDWPIEKRREQLLIYKIENVFPQLFKKIDHPKFNLMRDKFILPLKDQITSLYIIDYKNNPFYIGYEIYFDKEN